MTINNMNEKIKFVFTALFGIENGIKAQSILGPEGRELAAAVWRAAEKTQDLFGGFVREHVETTFDPKVTLHFPISAIDIKQLERMSEAVRILIHAKGELRSQFVQKLDERKERKIKFALSKLS